MKHTTRADLIEAARVHSGRPEVEVRKTFDTFLSVLTLVLKSGATVEMRGHFTLIPKTRKARPARNPRTGERVWLEERKTVLGRFPRGYL